MNLQTRAMQHRWGDDIEARPPEIFFSNKQAAAFLCVNEKFLYTLRRQRRGPPYETRGRKVLYVMRDLEAWREKQKHYA